MIFLERRHTGGHSHPLTTTDRTGHGDHMMKSAKSWKSFYRDERRAIGVSGLERLIVEAARIAPSVLENGGAIVFPHTRLRNTGRMTAAAARAVIESGRDRVIALGVMHGAREDDAPVVARANAGDEGAIAELRRLHGTSAPNDDHRWADEFSLDNFIALLEMAALVLGRPAPRVFALYPFLVGTSPATLPGLDHLQYLLQHRAVVVATTDPVHHGIGYGALEAEALPRGSESTNARVRRSIAMQFDQLARRDYAAFQATCAAVKSDFRDVGPVLAELTPIGASEIIDLELVNYADVLEAPEPTWAAGALLTVMPRT